MMKKHLLIVCCLILGAFRANAQQNPLPQLFTGTIDGKIAITMFLFSEDHPCEPKRMYQGIYKYDRSSGENKWLLLHIDFNEKDQFVMLEERFSGLMILRKDGDGFSGIWVHPDGVTQRKVTLKPQKTSQEILEKHVEYLDETNHLYHDC